MAPSTYRKCKGTPNSSFTWFLQSYDNSPVKVEKNAAVNKSTQLNNMKKIKLQLCCWLIAVLLLETFNAAKGDTLLIPLSFDKNSVQFIFTKISDTNYAPMGTCFLVDVADIHKPTFIHRVPLPLLVFFTYKQKTTQHTVYFVTAKHVLFDENGHLHPDMYMRLGNQAGGVFYSSINPDLTNGSLRIITPDDKSVDLAVFTIGKPQSIQEMQKNSTKVTVKPKIGRFDASLIADNKMLKKHNIREGEEMFFIGLFTPFYGANENIPICRFGHLSMLPDEPVAFGKDGAEHLYLMETEVFGGNSGSPAFFSFNKSFGARRLSELKEGQPLFSNTDHAGILFAGVVKGYFRDWSQLMLVNSAVTPYSSQNTGIAAIVPASYLYDILFSKQEQEFRDKIWKLSVHPGYK
jgi:hypothetical protein